MARRNPLERRRPFLHTITLQRRGTTVKEKRLAIMAGQPQKRQHHVFMVALQENIFRSAAPAEFEKKFDDAARGGPAIDVIADKHHGVSARRSNRTEHSRQFVNTAMDIADREQTPTAHS